MRFSTPLLPARLIRRYKRFLADIRLEDGREVTAHVGNPGSMLGLAEPGMKIWVEANDDPRRKLNYGWRLVDHENGHFTGVDTSVPNRALKLAFAARQVAGFDHLPPPRPEVPYGAGSRVDFLFDDRGRRLWVEVKCVTLSRQPGLGEFPDSVTARGARHLADLAAQVGQGDRAMLLYLVQRTDVTRVTLAADLDPAYARAFAAARAAGVEVAVIGTRISPEAVEIAGPLPFEDAVSHPV